MTDNKHFSLSKQKTKAFPIFIILVLGVAAVAIITMLSSTGRSYLDSIASSLTFHGNKVSLSLGAGAKTYKTGDIIDAPIILNPYKKEISGTHVIIHFDPSLVQVVPVNAQAGSMVERYLNLQGSVFSKFAEMEVDNQRGVVSFSTVVDANNPAKGAGKVADLNFKALKAGSTKITFDFTRGSIKDTNVLSVTGTDILEVVQNLQLTIQ